MNLLGALLIMSIYIVCDQEQKKRQILEIHRPCENSIKALLSLQIQVFR